MKTLNLTKYGRNHAMTFRIDSYSSNGNLYIGLICHDEGFPEPWQNLTVNLDVKCDEHCAFIDTNNNGTEIMDWLMDNDLGWFTGRDMQSGFCIYPEFHFNMKRIREYTNNGDDALNYWDDPIGDAHRDGYSEFDIREE